MPRACVLLLKSSYAARARVFICNVMGCSRSFVLWSTAATRSCYAALRLGIWYRYLVQRSAQFALSSRLQPILGQASIALPKSSLDATRAPVDQVSRVRTHILSTD